METQPVFQATAVRVGSPIGQRREKTGAEIAVGKMHLQPLEAAIECSLRGGGISAVNIVDLGDREFLHRKSVTPAVGNRRRRLELPAIGMVWRQLRLAMPRLLLAALTPGVAQLNGRDRAHVLDNGGDPRQTVHLGIVVDAAASRAGSPFRQDRDLLGEYQPEAAGGARPQQHDVEIRHFSVDRTVHGHRRHRDAVTQRDVFEREGAEQVGHDGVLYTPRWRATLDVTHGRD